MKPRFAVHTITTKPLPLAEVARLYPKYGVQGVTVWREAVDRPHAEAGKLLRDAGLDIVSYCRGGFFAHPDAKGRQGAIDDNRKVLDEAAELGAPLVVLVCGAIAGKPLAESRKYIAEGIATILPHAAQVGVKLGIEPLHPMYADTRSAVNTMEVATDMAVALNHSHIGVTVDAYHVWWDPHFDREIVRCAAAGKLFSWHICDWRVPTEDLLLDRGLMGEGAIPLAHMRAAVEATGFAGYHEVEIFSKRRWAGDQEQWLGQIAEAFARYAA